MGNVRGWPTSIEGLGHIVSEQVVSILAGVIAVKHLEVVPSDLEELQGGVTLRIQRSRQIPQDVCSAGDHQCHWAGNAGPSS